ncbi:MAG TPA: aspartate aminotransferase family protein, partial [Alphaproteobacteria bacterium]|nr:aspartate aminotransferase family protein [Alphaproteobacteria bacterium]
MPFESNSLEEHWMPFSGNRDFKLDPRLVVKSEGMYCWDHKGGKLIDGSSALFCSPAGHGRREIADAVHAQMIENDYTPHFQLGHPGSFELAERVARILPEPMNHVFFTNSGSESVDTAMKIALAYHRARGDGQRTRFVSRERAYHGVNMGGLSLSGMVKNRETFNLTLPNISMIRHTWTEEQRFTNGQPQTGAELAEDLQRVCESYGGSTIAAVFIEPVAGSTGTLVPPVGYLDRVREICDQHGILLIYDEVITGFGRMGTAFAAEKFGVIPDVATMAKALTNGAIPMGGVAVRDEVYDTVTNASPQNAIEFFHGYTYSAHPAACAAGIATQKIYEEDGLFERANDMSSYFLDAVWSLKDHPLIADLRGIGMMAGVEVKHDGVPGRRGTQLQKDMFWNGLHVKFTGDNGILAPAFVA